MRLFNQDILKKEIEELSKIEGNGTEMISLYIGDLRRVSSVRQYINKEMGVVDNIKSATTKKNITRALSSIIAILSDIEETSDRGLVIFAGIDENDNLVRKVIEPPRPVNAIMYRCDNKFHTEELMELFIDHDTYAFVVLDLSEATLGTLHGKTINHIMTISSLVPNKHSKGGQSSARFERLRNDAINEFFKKVGDKITEVFLNLELNGIIIAGPGCTKEDFVGQDKYIHHELKKKIIGIVNCGYTGDYGLKEAVNESVNIIKDSKYSIEKQLLDDFWTHLKKETGMVEYGALNVLEKLKIGAVDTLLLTENMNIRDVCYYGELAEKFGGKTVLISTDNEYGKMFDNVQIGCFLRYV